MGRSILHSRMAFSNLLKQCKSIVQVTTIVLWNQIAGINFKVARIPAIKPLNETFVIEPSLMLKKAKLE